MYVYITRIFVRATIRCCQCILPYRIDVLLFLALWISYTHIHQKYYNTDTPASRLSLLYSICIDHSVSIDKYHIKTLDKAYWRGHYYSDKAPGAVILCLPTFGCALLAEKALNIDIHSEKGWFLASWISCSLSIAVLTALGGVALFNWLRIKYCSKAALITTFAIFLGSAPFPYATIMYSHAFVIGLIAIALWAIDSNDSTIFCKYNTYWPDVLSGFALGYALASEFTAGLVVLFVGVYAFKQRGLKRGLISIVAACPALSLILICNYICYDSVWRCGYSYQASFEQMKHGLYGILWPNYKTAIELLFMPSRGLFYWTPFIITSIFGFRSLYYYKRSLFWLILVSSLLQIIVISGYTWDWPAGCVLGPRYLSPILPLLALPATYIVQKHFLISGCMAWISILLTGTATIIRATPSPPPYVNNPLTEIYLPVLYHAGDLNPNIGSFFGLNAYASIAFTCIIVVSIMIWLFNLVTKADYRNTAL